MTFCEEESYIQLHPRAVYNPINTVLRIEKNQPRRSAEERLVKHVKKDRSTSRLRCSRLALLLLLLALAVIVVEFSLLVLL
jgi:hypothetical protein